jgi:hypothetical protein
MSKKIHNQSYFEKHCEIVALLANRADKEHPAVKHHIRSAVREASNHVSYSPGSGKKSAEYMSETAHELMKNGDFLKLIHEHVVPVSVLCEKVMTLPNIGTESVAELIAKYTVRAVITKEDDDKLKQCGLNKGMPNNSIDGDVFSRYTTAKIAFLTNQYTELHRHHRNKLAKSSRIQTSP